MRRVHEQEGGSIRAPGVPSAGDRQATKSGIVLVLRSAPWSARVKCKDRNSTFSVVVASCGGRGGEAFGRPGSHPPVIGGDQERHCSRPPERAMEREG